MSDQPNRTTERMYAAAQADFHQWTAEAGHAMPVPHRDVAGYLRQVFRERGPSSVPVYLAALGRLYQAAGHRLDTKAATIQDVMRDVRDKMREPRPRAWR